MSRKRPEGLSVGTPGFRTAVRPDWFDPVAYPFTSREIEIDGCRVHYVDEGIGPVVLMLHGNPTWSFLYRGVIRGLREHFRCVTLDYPGFGLSRARPGYGFTPEEHSRVVEGLIDALDLSGITMVVQEWGGPIGFGAAARRPERFAAFVIGNTWAWPVSPDHRIARLSRFFGGALGGFLIRRLDVFVRVLLPLAMRRRRLSTAARMAYRGPFPDAASRAGVQVFSRVLLESVPFLEAVETGLAVLADRPALLVWGERDPVFTRRDLARWEELFPNHRTVILEGAGHFIQEEAPEEIVDAIREHAASPPGKPGAA